MRRHTISGLVIGVAGLLLVALLPLDAPGGPIFRVRAKFRNFDFSESATSVPPGAAGTGGAVIYTDTIFVPDLTSIGLGNFNTMFIHISSTSDIHQNTDTSNKLELSCLVDGAPCNPGLTSGSFATSGWLVANRHFNYNTVYGPGAITPDGAGAGAEDMHDNNISYTWCVSLDDPATREDEMLGTHSVEVRMAARNGADFVFTEASHFYIDLARVPGGCKSLD